MFNVINMKYHEISKLPHLRNKSYLFQSENLAKTNDDLFFANKWSEERCNGLERCNLGRLYSRGWALRSITNLPTPDPPARQINNHENARAAHRCQEFFEKC